MYGDVCVVGYAAYGYASVGMSLEDADGGP